MLQRLAPGLYRNVTAASESNTASDAELLNTIDPTVLDPTVLERVEYFIETERVRMQWVEVTLTSNVAVVGLLGPAAPGTILPMRGLWLWRCERVKNRVAEQPMFINAVHVLSLTTLTRAEVQAHLLRLGLALGPDTTIVPLETAPPDLS